MDIFAANKCIQMLVSIIIPIYNVENYIEECLESVYQQTYPHIEVILVNDCTPDHSMTIANTIVAKYKDKFPTTIINHEQNKGLSEARNSGMKIAKGKYIYFIDSDDAITLDAIEVLAQIAINHKDIEAIRGKFTRDENCFLKAPSESSSIIIFHEGTESKIHYYNNGKAFVWNILYKRSFIENHNLMFISNILLEDNVFHCMLIQPLTLFAEVSKITYFYRKVGNSITATISPKHIESTIYILQFIKNLNTSNIILQNIITKHFTKVSFFYWNYHWKVTSYHHKYFSDYRLTIKDFLRKRYKQLTPFNFILLSPALFPYNIAKYYVKIIWRIIRLRQ